VKRISFIVLLLCSAFAWAGQKVASDPSQYTVNIHVSESRLLIPADRQMLTASIDRKKYKLRSEFYRATVLALGDYKAKLVKDERKVPYELNQWYELLFPDNKT
jgi:hypothetical protein